MRRNIVIGKHTQSGPKFEPDEILLESNPKGGNRILSTGCNGTICVTPKGTVFGPNCPGGFALYEIVEFKSNSPEQSHSPRYEE